MDQMRRRSGQGGSQRVRSEKRKQPGRHSFLVVGQRTGNSEQRQLLQDRSGQPTT
jgi:hypothetical protein